MQPWCHVKWNLPLWQCVLYGSLVRCQSSETWAVIIVVMSITEELSGGLCTGDRLKRSMLHLRLQSIHIGYVQNMYLNIHLSLFVRSIKCVIAVHWPWSKFPAPPSTSFDSVVYNIWPRGRLSLLYKNWFLFCFDYISALTICQCSDNIDIYARCLHIIYLCQQLAMQYIKLVPVTIDSRESHTQYLCSHTLQSSWCHFMMINTSWYLDRMSTNITTIWVPKSLWGVLD